MKPGFIAFSTSTTFINNIPCRIRLQRKYRIRSQSPGAEADEPIFFDAGFDWHAAEPDRRLAGVWLTFEPFLTYAGRGHRKQPSLRKVAQSSMVTGQL
jgi:hypothetical protein